MKNIAIFASGSGSNAEKIIVHFEGSDIARIALVVTDNADAYVLARAGERGIESAVIPRAEWRAGRAPLRLMRDRGIDFIVLAGFLSLVPAQLVRAYEGRMVNIHPALLPAYGGKGMYGERVHSAVIAGGESESGITIHFVDEHYDKGGIIAQYRVAVAADETPQSLAAKIHTLEHSHFPAEIEKVIRNLP